MTRRCRLRVALPEAEGVLPGQFGTARLVVGEEATVVVPTSAILSRASVDGVYVVDRRGAVAYRSVRLGRCWDDQWEVLAGLTAGTAVVAQPPLTLADRDRIAPSSRDGH